MHFLHTVRRAVASSHAIYTRPSQHLLSYSTSRLDRRILCVDLPETLADATCVQELVQRGHLVEMATSKDREELEQKIAGGVHALLVSPTTKISRSMLQTGATAELKLIAVPTDAINSEYIDPMEATSQGVMLLQLEKKQVSDKFSVEAEIAIGLLIQLARQLPASLAAVKARDGEVERERFTGIELHGKQLGIVGLGQAGKCVAEMANAMGLDVYAYDPNLSEEAAECLGVKLRSLNDLYAQCDFLTFHAPLTGRTRRMFDDDALARCKQGVYIVSVAEYRGHNGILNEQTLMKGLASGHISGVGIDVLLDEAEAGQENVPEEWAQLMEHERVLIKSHVDTQLRGDVGLARRYRTIAENLSDALVDRYYRGVANGVFMGETLLPEIQPFLQLGEGIGRLLHQLTEHSDGKGHGLARVLIATSGGIQVDVTTPKAKSAIQGAVMKGMLEAMQGNDTSKISLLNSKLRAMAEGIDVRLGELSGTESHHLNNSIAVQVKTKDNATWLVMGSVFGEEPRVVRVNEYTDFPAFRPEGNLLMFKNEDKPGAIAAILKELSDAQINIANFGLSRQSNAKLAMGILALDSELPTSTLANLRGLSSVESIHFARI